MRIALIDCGTNTFNLLIVELNSDKSFETIFRTSVSVKLGDTSINKGYISANSFQRGIKTLKFFRENINTKIIAITGSCGKTTLKEMIGFTLKKISKTTYSPKSFNNKFGVPLSLFNSIPFASSKWFISLRLAIKTVCSELYLFKIFTIKFMPNK